VVNWLDDECAVHPSLFHRLHSSKSKRSSRVFEAPTSSQSELHLQLFDPGSIAEDCIGLVDSLSEASDRTYARSWTDDDLRSGQVAPICLAQGKPQRLSISPRILDPASNPHFVEGISCCTFQIHHSQRVPQIDRIQNMLMLPQSARRTHLRPIFTSKMRRESPVVGGLCSQQLPVSALTDMETFWPALWAQHKWRSVAG
jgi:hypothetical protein